MCSLKCLCLKAKSIKKLFLEPETVMNSGGHNWDYRDMAWGRG